MFVIICVYKLYKFYRYYLLIEIEPDFQYLNQTIQRHNQMVNFLIESCVNDELKKKILAKKIEKVVKIEDALSDVRKIPGPVFSALRESAYKVILI